MATSKDIRRAQRARIKKDVEKLQRAGLIGKVDWRKKTPQSVIQKVSKYRDVLQNKSQAIKAPDTKTARELRKKFKWKGTGRTLVIPKEKGERFTVSKKGEITSVRPGYNKGDRIKKKIGAEFHPPGPNEKPYYTIPERTRGAGKLKRTTFASFNDFLGYIDAYNLNFEDIEPFLEVEYVETGSDRAERLSERISGERAAAYRRSKRRAARKKKSSRRKRK